MKKIPTFNIKDKELMSLTPRLLAGISPAWFAYLITKGNWLPAKHLLEIDKYLIDALTNKSKRLIINMPPRHGKSEFISKYFAAWYLGMFPDKRLILTSYESTFAQSWGRKVMAIIREFGKPYFGIQLDKSKSSASEFQIDSHSGAMYTVGAGGAITGRGADLLIIDDPVKNDAEANSPTYRENVYEWFRSTAYTRLEPDGVIIIIMTRWHNDDLVGRLLRDNSDDWKVLNLPAIAEENDLLKRKVGEPLWKERFDKEKLEQIKTTLGEYWFSALYQQRPTPLSGGIFRRKYFKYFDEHSEYYEFETESGIQKIRKNDCIIMAACDLAATTSNRSDYTAIVIIAYTKENDILVIDVIREKIQGAEHLNLLHSINNRYKPSLIGIEAVQYQIALVQSALAEGLPVKALSADKDKISRALPAAAKIEAGKVYFKRNAHWLAPFINEILLFPGDKHDDQVDAFAYVCNMIKPVSRTMPKSISKKKRGRAKRLLAGF